MLRCRLAPLPPFQGREIGNLDHETRLVLPVCVTPFVKRQRPTMRYVSVKSAALQAQAQAQAAGTRHRQQA